MENTVRDTPGTDSEPAQDRFERLWTHGLERGRTLVGFLEEQGGELANSRVLDLGCATGGISLAFAERADSVTGLDYNPEEVARARQRTGRESGFSRGVHFGVASAPSLPLESRSHDITVLIGVLEYMGLSQPQLHPVEAQRRALSEIARVLKPGGTLLLATENRWYPPHLLRSPHQKTWLAEGLPTTLVRKFRRFLGWSPFWDRLHSDKSLVELIKSAGFSDVNLYIPVYGYQFPKAIVGAYERNRLRKVARREAAGAEWGFDEVSTGGKWGPLWFRLVATLGLQRLLVNSFIVVARKQPAVQP